MKQIYLLLFSIILAGCVKNGVSPASAKTTSAITKTDSVKTTAIASTGTTTSTYDWYNGTKGTAVVKVTCTNCTAIATIGNVSTPFLFNDQGVGELKYTPTAGLPIYIAICPGSVKAIKAEIFDATNVSLYSYAGTTGNWNTTYIVK